MLPLAERVRRLHPRARAALYGQLARTPGALADVLYQFEAFWAREDQIIEPDLLDRFPLIIFGGPRGMGKTRAAVELFNREIFAGRATRPRIIAGTEADVDKTVVHGISGIMACLPRELRPVWRPTEGAAGALQYPNGVEVLCFSAKNSEQLVGTAGDCDLLDDLAKWGPRAGEVWNHARTSCRIGRGIGIVATTRRGSYVLRKVLKAGEIDHALIRRAGDTEANRWNVTAGHHRRIQLEADDPDFLRQEIEDEDISATSPFAGLDFDSAPIRILIAARADFVELVVAIDPADGKGGEHDEWGIGLSGRRADGHVVALADASGSFDDEEAAMAALELCDAWGVSKIVVESNRGPRVLNALRAAQYKRERDAALAGVAPPRMPELVPITAKEGKRLRAGPLRALYQQGMLHHVPGLAKLERQQREWEPDGPRRPRQDDRIDWLVHAVHHLANLGAAGTVGIEHIAGIGDRVRQMQAGRSAEVSARDALIRSDKVEAGDPRSNYRARQSVSLSRRNVL